MDPDRRTGFDTVDGRHSTRFNGVDWFRRFRALYNASAASPLTELGLFYDRHQKFVQYGQRSDPKNPEYTDDEWNRVMSSLFGELAGDLGLAQAPDSEGQPRLEWYLPGVTDRPSVVIWGTSEASPTILARDLAHLSRAGPDLSVVLMYPDYPYPEGASNYDEAALVWRRRLEARLAELRPRGEILTLMISAYSFDLPAPWLGYLWRPSRAALEATH